MAVENKLFTYTSMFQSALLRFGISHEKTREFMSCYAESHRYYHTLEHIFEIADEIIKDFPEGLERDIMLTADLVHDLVYDPLVKVKGENERLSAEMFRKAADGKDPESEKTVIDIVLATADHKQTKGLIGKFMQYDLIGFRTGGLSRLMKDGLAIMREFQYYDYADFKKGRDAVVSDLANSIPFNRVNIDAYLVWLSCYRPKVGIYAGSFNPFHVGHMDILKKAEEIFDKVIIAIGRNPEKSMVEASQRLAALRKSLPYHQVEIFEGLLTDYAKKKEESGVDVTIIKGLRNGDDLIYEERQMRYMEDLNKGKAAKVVFILGGARYEHVSSSGIRQLATFNPEFVKQYIP